MDFGYSDKVKALQSQLSEFMETHVYPNEKILDEQIAEGQTRWKPVPRMEELKSKAKAAGLWNLFLPDSEFGAGLTNVEYAPLAEIMGRSLIAPEVFNCSAPDTGNMEVLVRYGSEEHKQRWLKPLLAGEARSAFAMTEPEVASSDATNIQTEIRRDGDCYVINGRKWFTSGAADPRCCILILMGKTDSTNPDRHKQQSMILVPPDTPGITLRRVMPLFGFDEAPHGHPEVTFENVRIPAKNLLLGEGRGFEIAQARLGPGRIHHCMRCIGLSERALEKLCRRLQNRVAFGHPIASHSVWKERIAQSRIMIEQARLLTLKAAHMMDTVGNKAAKAEIAMIKVVAPNIACQVLDWAIQAFGAAGVTNDFGLAAAYAHARILRIADGPDEVHRDQIATLEFKKHDIRHDSRTGGEAMVAVAKGVWTSRVVHV
jgi:acyl-CoA dehydrogenase